LYLANLVRSTGCPSGTPPDAYRLKVQILLQVTDSYGKQVAYFPFLVAIDKLLKTGLTQRWSTTTHTAIMTCWISQVIIDTVVVVRYAAEVTAFVVEARCSRCNSIETPVTSIGYWHIRMPILKPGRLSRLWWTIQYVYYWSRPCRKKRKNQIRFKTLLSRNHGRPCFCQDILVYDRLDPSNECMKN